MPALQIDKKQMPQVAVLGVISVGLFGYFGMKMITPPSASAAAPSITTKVPSATNPTAAVGTEQDATDASGAATTVDPAALIGATAPTDGMRDPFLASALPQAPKPDQPAGPAPGPAPSSVPGLAPVPGLPLAGQVSPLPVGLVDGGWSVYGVIASDDDPSTAIAILRRGEERRYVHLGDKIDDNTRLIGVDRSGVTILAFGNRVRLPLGGAPAPSVTAPKPNPEMGSSMVVPSINNIPRENAPMMSPANQPALPQFAQPVTVSRVPPAAKPV